MPEQSTLEIVLQVVSFSFALWLGLYLLARDFSKASLRFAGLGLLMYAVSLGANVLLAYQSDLSNDTLLRVRWGTLLLPATYWLGALITSLPDDHPLHQRLFRRWDIALIALGDMLFLLAIFSDVFFNFETPDDIFAIGYWMFAGMITLLNFALLVMVYQAYLPRRADNPYGLIITLTIFFAMGTGLLLLNVEGLSPTWVIIAVGGDLLVLGMVFAVLDAFDLGEALLPDVLRSFVFSLFTVLLFGGQIVVMMAISDAVTQPMIFALLLSVTTAIGLQVFADHIQTLLDKVVFAEFPNLRRSREELRSVASALPKMAQNVDLLAIDSDEFARLTRKALGHYGNLAKLASSPLTQLPIITYRLGERGKRDDTLARANELKTVLTESIHRLKPNSDAQFGISDEWRYYNALYFPYVRGIKPFSRRMIYDDLDSTAQEALNWFQMQIPERTLYNWQSTASKLVAQDIREQHNSLIST